MTETACRNCAKNDVPMRDIYKPDAFGNLVPSSAQCRDGCYQAKPAESQRTDRQRYRSNPRGKVWTAIRPGICGQCRGEVYPGDKLSGNPAVHYECSGNLAGRYHPSMGSSGALGTSREFLISI